MMVGAAMLGWTLGYALAFATRTVEGSALCVRVPGPLRRLLDR
jgi:hypothetical protein